jgi:ketosteroid isomerase-like protein
MGAPAAAAIIVRREREVIDAFRRAGAMDSTSARSFAELAIDESRAVKRLQRRSVLREAEPGRYYLDEVCWERRCGMRRQLMFTIVGIALLVLLAVLVSGSAMPPAPQAPPTPPGDTIPSVTLPSTLDRVLRDYERAWEGRDVRALAALFARDGFVLRPGSPPVRGRAAIEEAYRGAGGPLRLRAFAFTIADTVGYIIGGYSAGGGGDIGKFVLALRRGDGRWLIAADIDNGNSRR